MLRVAIIGAGGGIAYYHILAYKAFEKQGLVKICAYCDAHPESLKFDDDVKVYSDFNELLEKEKGNLDFVDICTPTFLHKEITVKALRAGLHVLCEKPMALNVEDTEEMILTSKETGKKLMIAQLCRFDQRNEKIKEIIENKTLGKLKSIEYSGHIKSLPVGKDGWFANYKLSGGPIFDVHVHDTDILTYFVGMPESLSAVSTDTDVKTYNTIAANLLYKDGVFASYRGDWNAASGLHEPGRALRFNFENGYIVFNNKEFVSVNADNEVVDLSIKDLREPFEYEIEYFMDCVVNDKPFDKCPPEESSNAIKIICAEMKSADNKGEKITF